MKLIDTVTIAVALCVLATAVSAPAQTRSTRDSATAYGARLTAKAVPADLNQKRVNSRINNRINTRLALRIERYRPESSTNPGAAFQTAQDDKSRAAPTLPTTQEAPQE